MRNRLTQRFYSILFKHVKTWSPTDIVGSYCLKQKYRQTTVTNKEMQQELYPQLMGKCFCRNEIFATENAFWERLGNLV